MVRESGGGATDPARIVVRLTVAAVLLIGIPAGVAGQAEDCPYEQCALRIESGTGFFSSKQIVCGASAVPVSSLSPSPELDRLFARSDSAAHWYEQFEEARDKVKFRNAVGTLLGITAVVVPWIGDIDREWQVPGLALSAGAAGFYLSTVPAGKQGARALSRAIWWYNRDLATAARSRPSGPADMNTYE